MEFLGEIKANVEEDSSLGVTKTEIAFSEMVNVLIMHAQSHHVTLQVKSLIYCRFPINTNLNND